MFVLGKYKIAPKSLIAWPSSSKESFYQLDNQQYVFWTDLASYLQ